MEGLRDLGSTRYQGCHLGSWLDPCQLPVLDRDLLEAEGDCNSACSFFKVLAQCLWHCIEFLLIFSVLKQYLCSWHCVWYFLFKSKVQPHSFSWDTYYIIQLETEPLPTYSLSFFQGAVFQLQWLKETYWGSQRHTKLTANGKMWEEKYIIAVGNWDMALRDEHEFERQPWVFWQRKHLEQAHGGEPIGEHTEITSHLVWWGCKMFATKMRGKR